MPRKKLAKDSVLLARGKSRGKRIPARSVSVANRIIDEVRELLLDGRIQAGDFLGTEAALAEHFGVGRSPMRDALRSLEARGIVDIRAGIGGGVYVAEGNPELFAEVLAIQLKLIGISLSELLDAIWAVEGRAVELAAANAEREDLDKLAEIVTALSSSLDTPEVFVEKSMEFHAAMVEASHSRALIAQAKMLRDILFKHYSKIVTPEITQIVFESLSRLAGHLAARAGGEARAQLDAHYRTGRRFMLDAPPGERLVSSGKTTS